MVIFQQASFCCVNYRNAYERILMKFSGMCEYYTTTNCFEERAVLNGHLDISRFSWEDAGLCATLWV